MRRIFVFFAPLIAATLLPLLAFGSAASNPYTSIFTADETGCQVAVSLPDAGLLEVSSDQGLAHAIELEGMIPISASGDPALQALVWTLEIPATSGVEYQLKYEMTLLEDIYLTPESIDAVPDDPIEPSARWQVDQFFPESILALSDPAILRNHRLVQVTLTPYQYNPITHQLRVYSNVEVDFSFNGTNPINQIEQTIPRSTTFETMISQNILNYDAMNENSRDYDHNLGLDPILYIYNSNAQSNLQPLLDWKRQKGHIVYTATESDVTLSSFSSIFGYIRDAYNDWDNPPVFVALVGDPSSCSFGTVVADGVNSYEDGDHGYSQLEGNDVLGDVFVGRLSVENTGQLDNVIEKQLLYEKTPYVSETDWFERAHLIGDNSSSGMSVVWTSENIRQMMLDDGFDYVSTCYNYAGCTDEVTSIINSINEGILYFNYRGWWGMSDWEYQSANILSNDEMLPLIITITCDTGTFINGTSITEDFYRAGTTGHPKGGVASIGTATIDTHTRYNNIVDLGINGGIFNHDFLSAGACLFQGKYELWQAYQGVSPTRVTDFSTWNNLMGDPSLELRHSVPASMNVIHAGYLVAGASSYPVSVNTGGSPVTDAVVCMYQSGHQVRMLTNAAGEVVLPLDGQFTAGDVILTVTKRDHYPYSDPMSVNTHNLWVDVADGILDDDNSGSSSGNNDGELNPGESIELTLNLTNQGNSTAYSVNATVSCADPRVSILQDYSTFSNIASGGTVASNELYTFSVDANIDASLPQNIVIDVAISTAGGSFTAALLVDLIEPLLRVELLETDPDGDEHISQGETGELLFQLYNWGTTSTGSLNATLT